MNTNNPLPATLVQEFKQKWEAYSDAARTAGITPPQDPEILAAGEKVFMFSRFVADNCIRHPALLADLVQSGDLQRSYASQDYSRNLKTEIDGVDDEDGLSLVLRRFRRREMIRIAWRDLAGLADLNMTMRDLSAFADACLDQSLVFLYQRACTRYGVPLSSDGFPQQLVVLGLGKLGARELNFSSDIDLIFAYPKSGQTENSTDGISNEDFFVRLGRQLIRVIGQTSAEGFVFRVDMRLRPYGESGPLVMDFDSLERYYQEQGREWERYAWIKARVVAGDKTAGTDLIERLRPFIYRRYLDFGAFESLRSMKQMITAEVQRKNMKNNIKLGSGGIREIEFFGQMFQLIRGGVTPGLQKRGIQAVLAVLAYENHIPQAVCDELNEAYVFLRNTENRLQAFADQQTHDLPVDPEGVSRLAAAMGFVSVEAFLAALDEHRQIVHSHFMMLLETPTKEPDTRELEKPLHSLWQGLVSDLPAEEIIEAAGFEDPAEVVKMLDYLRHHQETRALSTTGRQRLDKLMPQVIKDVGAADQPMVTLKRIIDLIKSIERRTSYLALLLESPTALKHLVELSSASPWVASFLSMHPVLLDELLDPRTLYKPPEFADLKNDLGERMGKIPGDDLEYQIEELCIFKQINVLRVAAADVTGELPLMRVSDHLSEIAETIINAVVELAWSHLVEKHGSPTCKLNGVTSEKGFAVIAYGKLGGLELGYGSDLDLVFLHAGTQGDTRGGDRPIDNAQFFNRLGQRVIHILTSHTRAGKAYEIDMRLRPSGSSGILVSHFNAFQDYQLESAWTWEHQALIKARAICGEQILADSFEAGRREVLAAVRDKTALRKEVMDMRERMRKELSKPEEGLFDLKQDPGGMVDIEFLVQYLVLLKSSESSELLKWTDNVRLLQSLIETGIMDENTAHVLKHAYLIYRAAAHQLSLQEKPAKVPHEKFSRLHKRVQQIWNTVFEIG